MGVLGPEPMDLFCPGCGQRHVDEGEWATRYHKTHKCVDSADGSMQGCGHEWRPHDYPTVGRSKRDQFKARQAASQSMQETKQDA